MSNGKLYHNVLPLVSGLYWYRMLVPAHPEWSTNDLCDVDAKAKTADFGGTDVFTIEMLVEQCTIEFWGPVESPEWSKG
jgi:hypothetical protein